MKTLTFISSCLLVIAAVGWPAHAELADMVTAGMTPARKSADFIVLDGNPLEDITNARRIDRVYVRGQAIDRAALKASWSTTGGS